MANMKTKLQFQILTAICVLLASLTAAMAQQTPSGSPAIDPSRLPALLQTAVAQTSGPAIDPTTGLPLAAGTPSEPQWIAPDWSDPDIILTNVMYDGLPLIEVAKELREQCRNQFDILPMPTTFSNEWGYMTIQLQLKNVRASEVFNAMNLVFENDRTPLRWELKSAPGGRQLVLLRVLPEAAPESSLLAPPPETHRMVYFVGNLLGDEKSGGMTMDQLFNTIIKTWPEDLGKLDGVIQFHAEAQLVIVNGTREQNEFVQKMLSALQQKAEWERFKRESAGAVPKTNDAKSDLKSSDGGAK